LLVGAPRQSHRYVEEYLKTVDRPQRQMSIRVLFVELNRDTESTLGLDPTVSGNFDFSVDGTSEGVVNRLKFATPTATIVNTAALNLKLQAMAAEGRGEIANRATVVAINNEETQFSSGLQVPIQRTSFSTPSSAGTQTQGDIQYIDIGIDTRMLPKILDDSEAVAGREPIRLNLALSISAEAGTATVNGESYPKIAKRTYGLPAIVKNGETLVIGGLAETVESSSEKSVPVIGQIPVLGWLFKSRGKTSKNRVLNAYITPVLDPVPSEEPQKYAEMNFPDFLGKPE
jgi:type II secretory pathway component GspD/PulD (secretin)